ncbi:MAG: FKBP-type peptidyl-prolyl cis-trans isomerase [Pseudomonadota bacterium]|nr:FKBP-type peptidyl-prolyl cis-trans isomerase [Pseudomonadota bacterium]
MLIATGDRVRFSYQVRLADGQLVDSPNEEDTVVTVGFGSLPEILEQSLVGRGIGDRFQVDISGLDHAFGVADPSNIQAIPLSEFSGKLSVVPGSLIEFQLPDGESVAGRVVEIKDTTALIDFNHPLIGKDICYEIRITNWQAAGTNT